MKKLLVSALLLTAVGDAQAHSHPGIDSLTHALEHLALDYPAGLPYLSGLGLTLVMVWLVWYGRRSQ